MARKALIHQIEARERRGRWFGALATLLSISLLLSGWVGLFAFLGANSAYGTFEEVKADWVPDTKSMELTLPDLSRVSRIYADSGEVLAELHDGRNSEPVAYKNVPERLVYAILAAEDSQFFEHEGIDFSAIVSAAIDNLISDRTRGGSTITQQVVKNAFVGSEVTIQRKITEAFVSAEVERRFPKERILEFYMNSVYFGAGAYGIYAASHTYFSKDPAKLTLGEGSLLAGLLQSPEADNPLTGDEKQALGRREYVLAAMTGTGAITQAQADAARAVTPKFKRGASPNDCTASRAGCAAICGSGRPRNTSPYRRKNAFALCTMSAWSCGSLIWSISSWKWAVCSWSSVPCERR